MTFKVGDPDPTPNEVGPDQKICGRIDEQSGECCTWIVGDKRDTGNNHIAGNGSIIVAVWPMY